MTIADGQRILGPDHLHTLVSRNHLANAHRAAGDLGRAIPLYEATLIDCERVLSDRGRIPTSVIEAFEKAHR